MLNMTLIGKTSLFFRDSVLGMYVGQPYLQSFLRDSLDV